ncbi:MAG TPA: glutamate racemase [Bacteroidales bacterium]|nr:glutamate racemase [Bacteroidales bacterium]HQL69627.1 glutamate racemase [Bacteroidales bacterium]
MNAKQPIGVFDSGIGGLTILKSLIDSMPFESYIYLGDSLHAPYGEKPTEEIIALSNTCVKYLIDHGCKIIVVACNTATGAAINQLRQRYPAIAFIGLEPAIKPACLATKTGNIGVLATEGTFKGSHFKTTSEKYNAYVNIHTQIGYGLVDLAESNQIETIQTRVLLKSYIDPLIEKNIDQLVLGCTHYPFFHHIISELCGQEIRILDSGDAVARRTKDVLMTNGLLNTDRNIGDCLILTSGSLDSIKTTWYNHRGNIDGSYRFEQVKLQYV